MVGDMLRQMVDAIGQQNQWVVAAVVFIATLALLAGKTWWEDRSKANVEPDKFSVGEITLDELQRYTGRDRYLPILFAVRGIIYDVTKGKDFYGPGGGYEKFAGCEVARALALMSLEEKDLNADLSDASEKQMQTLVDWETKFKDKYPIVGKICAPVQLTVEELAKYDGSDPKLPIYLAIKGTIFDVSKGRQFYGPNGIYPFAGKECARAFALVSTDVADCHDNLEGLGPMELDQLKGWEGQFYSKYKLVGNIKKSSSS